MGKENSTFGDVIDPRGRGPIERADFFLGLYRGGGESREMAAYMIGKAYGEFRDFLLVMERENRDIVKNSLGFESLTTDTNEGRSAGWLKRGRGFATGVSPTNFVAAVIHPKTGMGACNVNTLPRDLMTGGIERILDEDLTVADVFFNSKKAIGMLTTDEILRQHVKRGVDGALEAFMGLVKPRTAMRKQRALVMSSGVNYLDAVSVTPTEIRDEVVEYVRNHPLVAQMEISYFDFRGTIGEARGIFYDGKQPRFYNLEED